MNSWARVVTNPLGLAGFALSLVFSYLAKTRQGKKPTWIAPSAFAMALIALIGGLFLAYQRNAQSPSMSSNQKIGTIKQSSSGSSTLNAAGVQGNVSQSINTPSVVDRPPSGPLTEQTIMSALAADTESEKIVAEIRDRGIAFQMSPSLKNKFRSAGATKEILDELERSHNK